MKKIFKSLALIAAAAMTLSACNKEVEPQQDQKTDGLYKYSFAILDATKAIIGDENIVWEEGDQVGLLVGDFKGAGDVDVTKTPREVAFSTDTAIPAGTMAYAYYPFNKDNDAADAVTITLSDTQEGSTVSAMPMAGIPFELQSAVAQDEDTNGAIQFLNLGSLINFKVFSTDEDIRSETILSVTFEANGDIAGTALIDLTGITASNAGELVVVEGLNSVTVEQEESIPDAKEDANPIKMVIFPGTFSGTVIVTTNAATYTKEIPEREFARSASRTFGLDLSKAEREPIEEEPPMFVKVTSNDDLTSGNYLIVYEAGNVAFDGSRETLDGSGNTIAIEIVDDEIEVTSETEAAMFAIDIENGTVKSSSGYYIGVTSYGNGLKQNVSASAYGAHTISIDESGNASITLKEDGWADVMALRYNKASGDQRFRYYKAAGQQPIQLYKRIGGESSIIVWNLQSIAITHDPDKTEYIVGEAFDPSGMEVSATYVDASDASNTKVEVLADGTYTYEPSGQLTASDTEIVVSYKGKTAALTITVEAAPVTGDVWAEVTNLASLTDGMQIVIANDEGTYAMGAQNTNNRAAVAVTAVEGGIAISDDVQIITLEKAGDYWYLKVGEDEYLYAASSSSNYLKTDSKTAVGDNGKWALEEGKATAQGTNSKNVMQYNSTSTLFACYGSASQKAIAFYAVADDTNWNLESISVTTQPTKKDYVAGESFDPAGMVVTGHFVDADDNTHTKDEAVTGYTISPDGALATTDDHVTITYQGKSTTQAITVSTAPVVTYDFETVAELNALVTSTSATYAGYLTDAVVSFVPQTNTAIVKDATGSVMFYKSSHGLKQGQTYTGEIEVTAILYNSLFSEVTEWDATFTGDETVVAPENITLADLDGEYSTYQNAYVKAEGLQVTAVSGKNVTVSDGNGHAYVVFTNYANATCVVGDVITAIGTVTKYNSTEEIKVWKAADFTVTAGAPKAITFSQPSQTECSVVVSVGGSAITSGTTVASGTTVTLTATAGGDYTFVSWYVEGATVADASSATTTFTMGTSAVTISASFSGGGAPTSVIYDFADGNWTVSGNTLTDGTVSFTGEGPDNFKMNSGYFMMGKSGAYINFPIYEYPVSRIVVTGRSGASAATVQNIFVGTNAVSTSTTGVTGTNTYLIASDYQAAGTTYTLKVTSSHNTQITKIEVFF